MKTLLFSTLYPSSTRPLHGVFVETRLRELLSRGGVTTKVVAPVPWFPSSDARHGKFAAMAATPHREVHSGIDVLHPRFVVIPKVGMNVTPFSLALSARAAFAKLRREGYDFDVIDAHYYYPDGVAAAILGLWFKRPVTITARGSDVNLIPDHRIPRALILWAASRADASIGVSSALVERMRDLGVRAGSLHVMRNGVDTQRFQMLPQAEIRRTLSIVNGPVLLTVGNLHEYKGQRLAIQALALLREQHPSAQLYVVGDGPDRDALLREAAAAGVAQAVHMVGTVPNAELSRWFSAADVSILASSREGWPNVILESMACGTPVVASCVGGVPEIVQKPLVGRVVPERTPAAFARSIADLLAQGLALDNQRAEVRKYAQGFSWDHTSQEQLNLFTRLAQVAAKPHT